MSVNIFELFGEIGVKDQSAHKAIDKVVDRAKSVNENFTKGLNSMGSGLTSMGTKVATGVGIASAAIGGMVVKINETTASVRAMDEQFEQTFRDNMDGAMKAINSQVEEQGIHIDRLRSAWSSFYGSFKGAGHDANKSLSLTERYMKLAGDAAAYYDTSLEDVTGRLKSLMMGNFQAGDAIGLNVSATSLGIEANKRYGKSWQELSQEEKDFLLIDVAEGIYEASGAMGQGAREADNFENIMGNLASTAKRFVETIGSPILDSSIGILKSIGDNIKDLTDYLGELDFTNLKEFIEESQGLTKIIDSLFESIKRGLKWLSSLDKAMLNLYARMASVTAVTAPLLLGMGRIFSFSGKLSGGFNKLASITSKLSSPMMNLSKKIGDLGNLFPLTTRKAVRFNKRMNKLSIGAQKAVARLSKSFAVLSNIMGLGFWGAAVGGVIALLGLLPEGMRDNINLMIDEARTKTPELMRTLEENISEKLPEIMKNGAEIFANFGNMIVEALPSISSAAQTLLANLNQGIRDNKNQIFNTAVEVVLAFAQGIIDNLDELIDLGLTVVLGLADAIRDNAERIGEVANELFAKLLAGLIKAAPVLADAGIDIVLAIAKGIIQNVDQIAPAAAEIMKALLEAFKSNPIGASIIGAFIVNKLTKGIFKAITGKSLFGNIAGLLFNPKSLLSSLKGLGGVLMGALAPAISVVKGALGGLIGVFSGLSAPVLIVIGVLSLLAATLYHLWTTNEGFRDAVVDAWEFIKVKGGEAFDYVIQKLQDFWTWIQDTYTKISEMDWSGVWESLKQTVADAFNNIWTYVQTIWSQVVAYIYEKLTGLKVAWDQTWQAIGDFVSNIWNNIRDTSMRIFSSVASWVVTKLTALKTSWNNIWTTFKDTVKNEFQKVKSAVTSGLNDAKNVVINKAKEFWSAGQSIVGNIIAGINEKASGIANAVRGALNKARRLLPFSPPKDKTSPMYGIEKNGIAAMIAKGIRDNSNLVYDEAKKMMDIDELLMLNPNIMANSGLSGYTLKPGSPLAWMSEKLGQILELMLQSMDQEEYLMSQQNRQIMASGNIYMDGREVSKGIDDPLTNYQDSRSKLKARTKGEW